MPTTSPGTSVSLLHRLRDHQDARAWEKLTLVYAPLLRAWLRPAALQTADVDDLVQQVLLVVVRKLPQFIHNGHPGAFRAWLRGITANVLREFWRGREPVNQAPATAGLLDEMEDPASTLSRWWDQEHNRQVLTGLLRLVEHDVTPATWQAFRRLVFDALPANAVAAELGMSVNAVLAAKSRVLRRLRQEAAGLVD